MFRFGRYNVNEDVIIVLFYHKKKTYFYISEIRKNFGRGNGAAWGRFGLMRDIQ